MSKARVRELLARWLRAFFWTACLAALAGCLPEAPSPTPQPPTPTVTQTSTTTATIVWFPPTGTFTPVPTRQVTPTPDLRPVLGDLLLEDPFTDTKNWSTSRTAVGSIAYGKGELTLAVAADRGGLVSLRKAPELGDFYAEIDALPSLCRGEDAYGLLLRASSTQDFYRLALTCSGRVRLERLKGGEIVILQDWAPSGLIPGGMLPSRLGVYARRNELRIFINDVYQFSAKDPVWESGTLGVFARSAGDTPLTVSFSNLAVYSLEAVRLPTATLKP